ncbi:hypothetical protein [Sagittula salina]|uniref:DUF1311 domain-containing protein n=1 Tax=Sagittula salina TaxID=2820268 RepID=A0A940MLQ8_9RHOB|nr:hypothetical protein [Sagittula salina]MBP0481674.1 hypothetical protein [Sagittula salina]
MRWTIAAMVAALLAAPMTACTARPAGAAETAPDVAALTACVQTARNANSDPKACLATAHAPCGTISAEAPAAVTLCFSEAKDSWTRATAARLGLLDTEAPEPVALRARIEAKYDLLSGLLQCDRLADLGRLTEIEASLLQMEKTRCEATASGLAYIRLLWRVTRD